MSSFFLRLLLCLGLSYAGWMAMEWFEPGYGPIGLAIVSVVWGILFAPFVIALIPTIWYWARHSVLNQWQGKYYSFESHHIRFYVVDDIIWLPLKDLRMLIVPAFGERELRLLAEECAPIPGHRQIGVTEAGLLRLLATRTEHRRADAQMVRFKLWLITSAFPNIKRLPASSANA